MSYFQTRLRVKTWQRTLSVLIYRKRVRRETRKNFQLDLFDPDNGYYEYSAIVTNKPSTVARSGTSCVVVAATRRLMPT